MTVKQLKEKIKNLPDDMVVTISNDNDYLSGEYEATGVDTYLVPATFGSCTCEIVTDYKKRLE